MQYMLLIYGNEQEWANLPEDQLKAMYAAYGTFTQELIDSGAMRGGSELAPVATATTVRVRNGKVLTTDNVRSMSVDNVSDAAWPAFAGAPAALEDIAPLYLGRVASFDEFALAREKAGR